MPPEKSPGAPDRSAFCFPQSWFSHTRPELEIWAENPGEHGSHREGLCPPSHFPSEDVEESGCCEVTPAVLRLSWNFLPWGTWLAEQIG